MEVLQPARFHQFANREPSALTCSDTIRTVHQNHGHGGHVEVGFDTHAIVSEIVEKAFIGGLEDCSCDPWDLGEDITWAGSVLSALVTCQLKYAVPVSSRTASRVPN